MSECNRHRFQPGIPLRACETYAGTPTRRLLATASRTVENFWRRHPDHAGSCCLFQALGGDKRRPAPRCEGWRRIRPIHYVAVRFNAGQTPLRTRGVGDCWSTPTISAIVRLRHGGDECAGRMTKARARWKRCTDSSWAARQFAPPVNDQDRDRSVSDVAVASHPAHVDLARRYKERLSSRSVKKSSPDVIS